MESKYLQQLSAAAAIQAGHAVMDIYKSSFSVKEKQDGSPVTQADEVSHRLIRAALKTSGIPLISEEGRHPPYHIRRTWDCCWLVDPLDGTREFVAGNDEFTINIALIRKSEPVFGMIYAPVQGTLWAGMQGEGICRIDHADEWTPGTDKLKLHFAVPKRLYGEPSPSGTRRIAVSRSHPDVRTEAFIRRIEKMPGHNIRQVRGSSLKFCDLAEQYIHIYPRFASIWEWDTAAGHAILKAAGGEVYDARSGQPLIYNKESLKNPAFLALADKNELSRFLAEGSL